MSEPIRVLHFADIHIGMENYGRTDPNTGLSSRVVDFVRRLDEMVAYARDNDVDLVIFAGDAFKTRTPSPTFQREFAWRIRDLAEMAPVMLLVGNHDLQTNAIKASSIEIYSTLRVPNVLVLDEYEVLSIETKRGPVIIGSAPYPVRSRLMERLPGNASIRQTDEMMEAELERLLSLMAEEADQKAAEDETPRLLAGHFTVRGARLGSERSAMLGPDVQLGLGLLADPRWDYVALGHIHKHQNLTEGREGAPPVVYSGSLERIDFGEERDIKGFCWVELARGETKWRFVPVKARPMITISVDCQKESNPTQAVLKALKKIKVADAIIRLKVQLSRESDALFNDGEIRENLYRAGAFYIASIARDVERPERTRLATNPEGLSHLELLERYLVTKDYEPERRQALLERAEKLMRS